MAASKQEPILSRIAAARGPHRPICTPAGAPKNNCGTARQRASLAVPSARNGNGETAAAKSENVIAEPLGQNAAKGVAVKNDAKAVIITSAKEEASLAAEEKTGTKTSLQARSLPAPGAVGTAEGIDRAAGSDDGFDDEDYSPALEDPEDDIDAYDSDYMPETEVRHPTQVAEPVPSRPAQPVTTQPPQPVPSPLIPSRPVQPESSRLAHPVSSRPAHPVSSQPVLPVSSQPARPVKSQPAQLDVSQPAQPVASRPAHPIASRPAQPVPSHPAQPVKSQSNQPAVSQPAQPVTSRPSQPVASRPARPGASHPVQPAKPQPAQPALSRTARPSTSALSPERVHRLLVDYGLLIVERHWETGQPLYVACKLCAVYGISRPTSTKEPGYIYTYRAPFSEKDMRLHACRDHADLWPAFSATDIQGKNKFFAGRQLPPDEVFHAHIKAAKKKRKQNIGKWKREQQQRQQQAPEGKSKRKRLETKGILHTEKREQK